jgi:hypothetical protein
MSRRFCSLIFPPSICFEGGQPGFSQGQLPNIRQGLEIGAIVDIDATAQTTTELRVSPPEWGQ